VSEEGVEAELQETSTATLTGDDVGGVRKQVGISLNLNEEQSESDAYWARVLEGNLNINCSVKCALTCTHNRGYERALPGFIGSAQPSERHWLQPSERHSARWFQDRPERSRGCLGVPACAWLVTISGRRICI